jgi:hypothetical protein
MYGFGSKCKLMHNYIYKNALSKELRAGFYDNNHALETNKYHFDVIICHILSF